MQTKAWNYFYKIFSDLSYGVALVIGGQGVSMEGQDNVAKWTEAPK